MKYTIHSTREDYRKMYEHIAKLESKLNMTLNWKKVKRASYDSLAVLVHGLENRFADKIIKKIKIKKQIAELQKKSEVKNN